MILVDSSVWISAWKGDREGLATHLATLIEAGQVALNWLIRTEILQGARDTKHQHVLHELLSPIPVDPFPDTLWDKAPHLYLHCRERGITLTTIDCLIATHAQIGSHTLWSLDKIFEKITGLKIFRD